MPKNIVICCDGTGNEIEDNLSNVLKLFRVLQRNTKQLIYYHPGVGTISSSSSWSRFKNKLKAVFGLVTGFGLDDNVLDAYRFLIQNYKAGDQVYLFGFSRGAYTVRVLAGFINLVGLLRPEQENLASYALTAYKQSSEDHDLNIAWRFQEVSDAQRLTIRFMGVWDTVGSVIVPRPDRLFVPTLQHLPYTHQNPCVQVFRHAMAIDERRRMFRLYDWHEPQKFKTNPFLDNDDADEQDIKQRWFSGVHSDIGGGYPESDSGAAKIPLRWMIDEATEHGLQIKKTMYKRLVLGQNPKNSKRQYVAPDPHAGLHNSMNWAWNILEWIPKSVKWREWPQRKSVLGVYLPRSEPRLIAADANIDPSVAERQADKNTQPAYSPVNLPDHTEQ